MPMAHIVFVFVFALLLVLSLLLEGNCSKVTEMKSTRVWIRSHADRVLPRSSLPHGSPILEPPSRPGMRLGPP